MAGPTDHSHAHTPARPFARLRQLLRPERRDTLTVLAFAGAVAVLSLASPIAVESLVNTVAFGVLMWPVVVIAGVLFACLALAAAIRAMQVYVIECIQKRLFVRVVADYAERLPKVKLSAFDARYGPELANRFFDVLNLQKAVATLLLDGVSLIVTAVVGMVVLAFYHPFLLGFDVALVVCVAFLLFVLGLGGVKTSLHESHAKYDVAAWLEELFRERHLFRSAGGRRLALEQAGRLADEYVDARHAHFRVVWRQTLFALGLQVVASTALLGLGGWLVIDRQLTLGQLVAAELIVTLVVASLAKLGKYAETWYDLLTAAEKLGLVTDLPGEREGGELLAATGRGMAISAHGVDRVSGRTLSLSADWRVEPGERVALVGASGAGVSTVFEVLCGLRDPDRGTVKLDGIDLRSLSPEGLRTQIGLAGGVEVFSGSLIDNVRVGRDELAPADIRAALKLVELHEVVEHLPLGLETPLLPDGSPLSTSQALRLMIARAVVGKPRLLLLDGILDRLDHRETPDLLPRLFDRGNPWTLLIASHLPQVVGMCDRIVGIQPSHHGDHS